MPTQGSAEVSEAVSAAQLQEVRRDFSAVAFVQEEALQKIGLRLERLELKTLGPFRNDMIRMEAAEELRDQVADLALRMPSAEHLQKQTTMLAGLVQRLGEVQLRLPLPDEAEPRSNGSTTHRHRRWSQLLTMALSSRQGLHL